MKRKDPGLKFLRLNEWKRRKKMMRSDWEELYSRSDPWGYLGSYNERIRNSIIAEFVKWSRPGRGLDMACGEGTLTKVLAKYVNSLQAFDISERAIAMAKSYNSEPNIQYFQNDIKDFTADSSDFDFILCAEVIYYLNPKEIDKLFFTVDKALQPWGYFILTTRINSWFSFDDFTEIIQHHFTVIAIIPVWRPEKLIYKAWKRAMSIFSPLSVTIRPTTYCKIDLPDLRACFTLEPLRK